MAAFYFLPNSLKPKTGIQHLRLLVSLSTVLRSIIHTCGILGCKNKNCMFIWKTCSCKLHSFSAVKIENFIGRI